MTASAWNRPAPPGFQGLREDLPLRVYWRHLPHWRQPGATYFVTFRLADSLPQSKLRELASIKAAWARTHGIPGTKSETGAEYQSTLQRDRIPNALWQSLTGIVVAKVEGWLDQGIGECWMNRTEVSAIVAESLHHMDDDLYELGCYVLMPNHIHAVIRPLQPQTQPLEKILQSRKCRTSRAINELLGRRGALWQEETFDRIVRDEEHLYRCIEYIGRNPTKAGLPPGQYKRWIRPSWESLGWQFPP